MSKTTKELQVQYYDYMRRMNLPGFDEAEYQQFVEALEEHAKCEGDDAQAWRILSEALIFCRKRPTADAVSARQRACELAGGPSKKDRKWLAIHDAPRRVYDKNVQDYMKAQFNASKIGLTNDQLVELGKHLAGEIFGGRPEEVDHFHETRNWYVDTGYPDESIEKFIDALRKLEIMDDYSLVETIHELNPDEGIIT